MEDEALDNGLLVPPPLLPHISQGGISHQQ